MKKLALLTLTLFSLVFSASAQWKLKYATDEYTDKKVPQLIYHLKEPIGFVRYLDNALEVLYGYDDTDNFDMWWDLQMDSGWTSYDSDLDINFIGNAPEEYNLEIEISNIEKGVMMFAFALDDEDHALLNAMKANKTMKIRFYDSVKEKTRVLSLPLTGITALSKKAGF